MQLNSYPGIAWPVEVSVAWIDGSKTGEKQRTRQLDAPPGIRNRRDIDTLRPMFWFVTLDWENPDQRGLPADRWHVRLVATANDGRTESAEAWCGKAEVKKLRLQGFDDDLIRSAWLAAAANIFEAAIRRREVPDKPVEVPYTRMRDYLEEPALLPAVEYAPGVQIHTFDEDAQ